jgi:hypothetical protein
LRAVADSAIMIAVKHLAWVVLVVVACDHRPAPRRSAPAASDAGVVGDAGRVADAVAVDVTQACTDVGVKVAAIWVQTAATPTEKAQLEQEQARIVRTMSENCTRSQWSEAARSCMLAATTRGALQLCQQQHVPMPVPPAAPQVGSGSAG